MYNEFRNAWNAQTVQVRPPPKKPQLVAPPIPAPSRSPSQHSHDALDEAFVVVVGLNFVSVHGTEFKYNQSLQAQNIDLVTLRGVSLREGRPRSVSG